MEVNFCQYLINIGFINKESFSNLILQYHKDYSQNTNNNFLENMNGILNNFINNLSKEEKNFMSLNLVKYYLQSTTNKKLSRLKSIYMLYKSKISLIKLKYLNKWKSLIKQNNGNNFNLNINKLIKLNKKAKRRKNRNEQNELDKYKYNFLSMKLNDNNKYINKFQLLFNTSNKKKHKIAQQNESSTKKFDTTTKENTIKNKKNISELLTSSALKEQKELQECTFCPKINHTSRGKSPQKLDDNDISSITNNYKYNYKTNKSDRIYKIKNFEIFDKLHNDNIVYRNKIKLKKEKYEKQLNEQNTFKPKVYNNSFTRKYSQNSKSFSERQKSFLEKKIENSDKIKKIMDEKFSKICSFVPEINILNSNILKESYTNPNEQNQINRSNKCISPFIRLYEDSKSRSIRQNQREKDYDNYIIDMANNTCKKDNNVDYDKLNELYLYQKKNEIIKRTRKKVEDEEGSTFRPDIFFNDCSKHINSDFLERSEKFLKDKQNFIETSIKEQNKEFNKDKFSKEQKKEIIKNIVKRLTKENNL